MKDIAISKGLMKIIVMDFPYRKKKGLGVYDYHSNAYVKVATFNNEESAECFMEYLAKFVGARMDKDV